ncbi:MAG: 5-formyltetrahydrofolate cyclo-ligase [Candidatus Micrarchaeia archaeon]
MKHAIREKIRKRRQAHSLEERRRKSELIMQRLFSLPEFKHAKTILMYISYEEEVQTHEMIERAVALGKRVVVPITDTETGELKLSLLKNMRELRKGAHGIYEPMHIHQVSPEEIELAVVPGVAFDIEGTRLGHGHGYFDKLLKKIKAPFIGLAFEFQVVFRIPREEHDVPVDKIITEKRILDVRSSHTNL